jgi:alkanesulfonate monooxygenase SsuD/methylene tetrahydromethanopterin reductase-like flavin-dependent oxidoreductase (luciferase family)
MTPDAQEALPPQPARDPGAARVIKVGLILPLFSGDMGKVMAAAIAAEELGFDGVFAFDHFFPPGAAPDRPALEAFTTLAAVAAATERVHLGTLVTRAVLRPPGMVAKMTSTIDLVSGGRMILGLGTGDPIDRPEHHTFGFPNLSVTERRAHLEETVSGLKSLFRGESYAGGQLLPLLAGPLLPPPVHPGGPPVWIGAQNEQVVRMAGRLADGWNGWGLTPQQFRAKAEILWEEADRSGRKAEATWAGIVLVGEDQDEVEHLLEDRRRRGMEDGVAFAGTADTFAEYVYELAAAGATWAIVVLAGPPGRRQLIAERVLPALAGAPASDL